jgi:hypothetical protein
LEPLLASPSLELTLANEVQSEPLNPDPATREKLGERLLVLYFTQLIHRPSAVLDLRPDRFGKGEEGRWSWAPKPLWVTWDADFLPGLRDLYGGFYEKDDGRFQKGLDALGVSVAGDIFQEQFGSGDAHAVRFSVKHFQDVFTRTFVRCRDSGAKLHRNFLPLGLYLACLYTQLERLDLPLDVNRAYHAALGSSR